MPDPEAKPGFPARSPRDERMRASSKRKRCLALQCERGGRKPKWADGQTLKRLVQALADPAHGTKAAAARAAGIGYATLARWQDTYPELHDVWQTAQHARYRHRQAAAEERRTQRTFCPRPPTPTKQMRLVCWFLVFRVHPQHALETEHEVRACERVRLSWERWQAAREQFPVLMAGVCGRRARRLAYLLAHGSIGLNYCPPADGDAGSRRYPVYGLHYWSRGNSFRDMATHEQAQSPRTGQRWL